MILDIFFSLLATIETQLEESKEANLKLTDEKEKLETAISDIRLKTSTELSYIQGELQKAKHNYDQQLSASEGEKFLSFRKEIERFNFLKQISGFH